jgi:hypothetical protein
MTVLRRLAPLIALLLLAAPVRSQYRSSYGYTFNNPVSAFCNDLMWNDLNARQTYKALLKKKGYTDAQIAGISTKQMIEFLGGETRATAASAGAKASPGASLFSPAGKRLLFPALAQSLASDAAGRKALLEVFEAGMKCYEEGAAENGFINDLAGAMAYFVGVGYFVIHDGEVPDEKGLDEVGFALRRSMDTPRVRSIADSEKQKFYELMIGLGTYFAAAYRQSVEGGDAKSAALIKDAANEGLKGFLGLDPASIRITRAGLEIAGGR